MQVPDGELRCVLFGAVSSEEQAEDKRTGRKKPSLDAQLERAAAFANAQRWRIVDTIRVEGHSRDYDWLPDLERDCAEYARLVQHIRQETVDVVICTDYDRLWRRAALQAQLCSLADTHNVWLLSLNQPSERGNEQSNLWLRGIYGLVAQQENISRVSRIRARQLADWQAGLSTHYYNVPYGYRKANSNVPAEIYEPEAYWVRLAGEWRAKGWGYYRIRRELAARGEHWTPDQTWYRLHNPFYAGLVVYREWSRSGGRHHRTRTPRVQRIGPGQHQPIWPAEMWEAIQEVNHSRLRDYPHADGNAGLFTGLVYCGECGCRMYYSREHRDGCHILCCSAYRETGGRVRCFHQRREAKLKREVLAQVRGMLSDPEAWREALKAHFSSEDAQAQIAALKAEMDREQTRLQRTYDLAVEGVMPVVEARDRASSHRERIAALQAEVARLEHGVSRLATAAKRARSLQHHLKALERLPDDELRPILLSLVERITVRRRQAPDIGWRLD